jgi:xylulokinase
MEGVSCEVRVNLEVFREQGSTPQELRVTGGGSRSETWNQIMADVCGIPLKRGELEESTAIGAAILAAYGTGQFKNVKDAANKIAVMSKVWEPNPANRPKYDAIYKLSRKIIADLTNGNIYAELEKIRQS